MWRRTLAVSVSEVFAEPSGRVSDVGTGVLGNSILQVLYNFRGVCLVLSVQNFFQDSCLALIRLALYRFLRALKRAFEVSLRFEFLHLLTLRFRALTCFLRTVNSGDQHGTILVFGRKGGKHLLLNL